MIKKAVKATGKVRIIGGFWRSRQLSVLDQEGLRPSTDRVRETLFNWLKDDLQGATCLDLFAGSGALGLEAASRGAKYVQLLEHHPLALSNLKNNFSLLQPSPPGCDVQITRAEAVTWMQAGSVGRFDLIFVDPPFDDVNLMKITLKTLGNTQFQTQFPIIYVESPSKLENAVILEYLPQWTIDRQMTAGVVKASLLKLSSHRLKEESL